jgi:hypothetical protein
LRDSNPEGYRIKKAHFKLFISLLSLIINVPFFAYKLYLEGVIKTCTKAGIAKNYTERRAGSRF